VLCCLQFIESLHSTISYFQANTGKQVLTVCQTFSEENIRRFPKEGGALLSAPGHPIGCGSPVATSVRSTEARTEPTGETEQPPVGMGFHRGTAFHLAHDFDLQSLVCYTFCDRWQGKGAAECGQTLSGDSRTERFCNAVKIAKLIC